MNKMIIRPYTKHDFQGIVEVIKAVEKTDSCPEVYPQGLGIKRIKQELEHIKNYWNGCFLVAEDKNGIAGFIVGHGLWMFVKREIPHLEKKFRKWTFPDDFYYYQRGLIIHPSYQHRTLGYRLVKSLKENAKGCDKIFTRTLPQNKWEIKFFESIGYREIFRSNNPKRIYFVMEAQKPL